MDRATSTGPTEIESLPIAVEVPAAAENLRIVRVVASSIASSLDFAFDRIEDLALAIAEAYGYVLVGPLGDQSVVCSITPMPAVLRVSVRRRPASEVPGADQYEVWESSLNRVVLESVASDVECRDGVVSFTMRAG